MHVATLEDFVFLYFFFFFNLEVYDRGPFTGYLVGCSIRASVVGLGKAHCKPKPIF